MQILQQNLEGWSWSTLGKCTGPRVADRARGAELNRGVAGRGAELGVADKGVELELLVKQRLRNAFVAFVVHFAKARTSFLKE